MVRTGQLVRLLDNMSSCPVGTIGYEISGQRFVVVAGCSLGVVDCIAQTSVEILKSGTLTLEIE